MSATPPQQQALTASFRAHRQWLWGLCYRMTGSTADADDLLQETYTRALEKPPKRAGELRPWLVQVAMNLARDVLRRRRRRGYVGPWLPTPSELAADGWSPAAMTVKAPAGSGEARYQLAESASYAFLVALEALTPKQRAVLLLRDVLDHSVRETAALLTMSASNVKTTLHRARHAMRDYDVSASTLDPSRTAQQQRAVEAFLMALVQRDVVAAAGMLAEDVRAVSDGGGQYFAAKVPIVGAQRVARFYVKLAAQRGSPERAV
ncbi:MAG TPA: sigma-70 family RNA polymerase sigma factor, partial [Sorangium sp.]|nr:sigma-70 family RNA polymerase sigma factor [Sorangium sp.]